MTDLYQYPWNEAPPEAMWAATDEDGCACWYINKPFLSPNGPWFNALGGPLEECTARTWPAEHWQDSVRQRPLFGYIEPRINDLMKSMRVSLDYWNLDSGAWMVIGEYMMQAAYRGAVATLDYRRDTIIEKTKGEKDD